MNRVFWHVLLAVGLFAGFSAYELLTEDEAISLREFLLEDAWPWLLLSIVIAVASELAFRHAGSRRERSGLSAALVAAQRDSEKWRANSRHHAEGLGLAIRAQFRDWSLTPGECDVAMLLLKGLSHKEVARVRNSSPATVRQQAASIYQKSGLSSRAGLAAFFLEDLFPSRPEPEHAIRVNGTAVARPELIQHMS
jgi:DNA-binding NarL/FixJ family response regulator